MVLYRLANNGMDSLLLQLTGTSWQEKIQNLTCDDEKIKKDLFWSTAMLRWSVQNTRF
jgi:hypothetical protein